MNESKYLSHSMAHYLLTIHKLRETRGFARVTDVAKHLGLTKGSVSTAVNNLKKKNLVHELEDTKFLALTETAHKEVHRVLSSRTLLYYFLKDFLAVSDEVAELDSCDMEHLISPETGEKFFKFMKMFQKLKDEGKLPEELDLEFDLNLNKYETIEDFMSGQMGDEHLGKN